MKRLILFITIAIIGLLIYYYGRSIGPALLPPQQTKEPTQKNDQNLLTPSFPLTLDQHIKIGIFAQNVGGARVIIFDPNGVMLVSVPADGEIIAIPDTDNNLQADKTITIASKLNRPHGLAFWQENGKTYLYVGETNGVRRFEYDSTTMRLSNSQKIMDLPSGGGHYTRTIGFGPDGKLYISIGSSCNVCIESDERRATIMRSNPDGSDARIYAKGLRNSVFFIWHEITKELWATDMGRDLLGDDTPPDEINIISPSTDSGQNSVPNFGWPICYGKNIHDTQFDKNTYIRNPCMEPFEKESLIDLQAHSAPLGLAFIPSSWPKELTGDLLVSYHGSWNRSIPTGYKIVRFEIENNRPKNETAIDFISGWLVGNQAISRPVDLKFDSKDRLFISDDKGGMIYIVMPK